MIKILVLMLIMIPSSLLAFTPINTGNDLYHNLKVADDPKNMDDMINSTHALGYLRGSVDGIIYMQKFYYDRLFPTNTMTEKEIKEYSKKLDLVLLSMPEEGIADGQMILVFKKYAGKYPEELNSPAHVCILRSMIDTYGRE